MILHSVSLTFHPHLWPHHASQLTEHTTIWIYIKNPTPTPTPLHFSQFNPSHTLCKAPQKTIAQILYYTYKFVVCVFDTRIIRTEFVGQQQQPHQQSDIQIYTQQNIYIKTYYIWYTNLHRFFVILYMSPAHPRIFVYNNHQGLFSFICCWSNI